MKTVRKIAHAAHNAVTISHKLVTTHASRNVSDFGKNLLRARNLLSWTRSYLASKTVPLVPKGVHENTIYNIEKGITPGSLEIQRVIKEVITAELKRDYPWDDGDKPLDKNSLAEFLRNSEVADRIDHAVATAANLRVVPPESFLDMILDRASYLGTTTVSEIEGLLKQNEQILTAFGKLCYANGLARSLFVPRGFCIGALQGVLLVQKNDFKTLVEFVKKHGLDQKTNPEKRARSIKRTYELAKKELGYK